MPAQYGMVPNDTWLDGNNNIISLKKTIWYCLCANPHNEATWGGDYSCHRELFQAYTEGPRRASAVRKTQCWMMFDGLGWAAGGDYYKWGYHILGWSNTNLNGRHAGTINAIRVNGAVESVRADKYPQGGVSPDLTYCKDIPEFDWE